MAGPKKQFQRSDVLAKARRRLGLESLPGSQDREGLFTLTRLLYPALDIQDPRYIAWQYDQNPSGPAYERIGRVQNKVIGQYTVIPMRYKLGARAVKGSLSVNTMTHPNYRGQGLFMLLAEEVFQACKAEDTKITLGFPNPNSYKGFLKHLDFKDIGSLPLWILPLNLSALAKTDQAKKILLLPLLLQLASPLGRLYLRFKGLDQKSSCTIQPVKSFDDSFNAFWESVRGGYRHLVVRDQRYLDWRFTRHPTREYSIYNASVGGKLMGYVVTRKTTLQNVPCGMIVDLLVPATPDGQSIAEDLIRSVTRSFNTDGLALAGCLAPSNSVTAKALSGCGYVRCPNHFLPQPFPVIARWNTSDTPPEGVFDLANWYLTMGDYDAV